jgi:hypothetical protein
MARAWYGSAPKGRWQEITQLMSAIEIVRQLSLACRRLLSMLEGIYHPANAAEGEGPAISIKEPILTKMENRTARGAGSVQRPVTTIILAFFYSGARLRWRRQLVLAGEAVSVINSTRRRLATKPLQGCQGLRVISVVVYCHRE